MTEKKAITIYEKLKAIMEEVQYIQKKGYNKFHQYNYATEADVKEAVRKSLIEHRVLFFHEILEQIKTTVQGQKGSQTLTTIKLGYKFINIDNPKEVLEGSYYGDGIDSGDKGIYKAITGAVKYILMTNFLIPTGDDPEGDSKTDKHFDKGANIQEPFAGNEYANVSENLAPPVSERNKEELKETIKKVNKAYNGTELKTEKEAIDFLNKKTDLNWKNLNQSDDDIKEAIVRLNIVLDELNEPRY